MRRIAAPYIALLVIAASRSQLAAEEVNLSRYSLIASAPAGGGIAFSNVDKAALVARCRDHDGCRVTVKVESVGALRTASGVLFLSELDAGWVGPPPTTREVDGDAVAALVMGTDPGQIPRCRFLDADDYDIDLGLLDLANGFAILNETDANAATCTLVIED